jgi:hypothetical protein
VNQETWKFINTFAPWLSAIGTLAAVIVSLYLARANKPIKLQIRAGHRLTIETGQRGKPPEFLYISAINVGHRTATVTNVGWRVGFWKKRHVIQLLKKDAYSSGIPVTINDGEEARWLVSLDREDNWVQRFASDYLTPNPRLNIFWMRLQVYTSVGKKFETRIEKSLKERLLEECEKQQKKKGFSSTLSG